MLSALIYLSASRQVPSWSWRRLAPSSSHRATVCEFLAQGHGLIVQEILAGHRQDALSGQVGVAHLRLARKRVILRHGQFHRFAEQTLDLDIRRADRQWVRIRSWRPASSSSCRATAAVSRTITFRDGYSRCSRRITCGRM